ncbi:hypothetical protein JKP88DRAFT_281758 [Tribonema minus]|uniref:Sulfotransferase n=1 Tax=Tribonema minus TaxID=303371 RepID=A0A836CB21_9STRA|nr:hypothetical protein JKP88DRAFT_281758 [Tribonema minus]
MEPEDVADLTLEDMLVGCGRCEADYVRKLFGLEPHVAKTAQRAVCLEPPPESQVSQKPLIIGAGPGTTATRSVSKAVNLLGLRVVHYGAGFERDGTPYPPGVSNACSNWDKNLALFGVNDMYDMLLLNATTVTACHDAFDAFNLRLYDDLDAVFDSPVHHVTYRLLQLYPNAKLIFTHRDPDVWVEKRVAHQMAMPAVQQPCGMILEHLTNEQNVAAYNANLELLECIMPAERMLMVNVWAQPGREIFESLADFLQRPVPPEECAFPGKLAQL